MASIGIACGGTGGHVFPGLAIGNVLRQRGHRVIALISGQNTEHHIAQAGEFGLDARGVPSIRLPAHKAGLPLFAVRFCLCGLRSRRVLRAERCEVVLGMGSFAAAPACLGAVLGRVPLVLHEGNAVVGRANRQFSRFAAALATSLPLAPGQTPRCRTVPTGLPVRQAIIDARNEEAPLADEFAKRGLSLNRTTVLAFGGSQGADALNRTVPAALDALAAATPIQVVHLTGEGRGEAVRRRYAESAVAACVQDREDEMHTVYRLADLAICRAGASTLTELGLLRKPAVLVPLPSAADDHQTANARVFEQSFPARVVPEAEATPEALAAAVRDLLSTPAPIANSATPAAPFLPNPNAATAVADLVGAALP